MKYEPAMGSGFLLTYDNALSTNLVMTAGFGWLGEINNQFNQTKYDFPAVARWRDSSRATSRGTASTP